MPDTVLGCPICLEKLGADGLVPLLLPCCGHTFCASCLRESLARSGRCPLCRGSASLSIAVPNRALGERSRDAPPEHRVEIPPYVPPLLHPPARRATLGARCREHEPRLRCVCTALLVVALMVFLRVEEEEFGRQTGTWRGRRIARGSSVARLPQVANLRSVRSARPAPAPAEPADAAERAVRAGT